MKKSWWIIAVLGAALGAGLLLVLNRAEPVPAVQLKREDVVATLTVTGEVEADTTVSFSPPVTARITSILVNEGDKVQKGQLLARLELSEARAQAQQARDQAEQSRQAYEDLRQGTRPEEIRYQQQRLREAEHRVSQSQAALAQAKVRATDAKRNATRFASLYKDEFVSRQEYESAQVQSIVAEREVERTQAELSAARGLRGQIKAQLDLAVSGPTQAKLAEARAALRAAEDNLNATLARINDYRVNSTLAGIVTNRLKDPGDLAQPGEAIVKVIDPSTLLIFSEVEENDLAKIKMGDSAYVVLDALPDKALPAEIVLIGEEVNPDNGTVRTRVKLLPAGWRMLSGFSILPGMTADVNIVTGQLKQVMVVPAAAVRAEGAGWITYRFVDHHIVQTPIQGRRISLENFLVEGGLQTGDWVAAVASEALLKKGKVEPVPADTVTRPTKPHSGMAAP